MFRLEQQLNATTVLITLAKAEEEPVHTTAGFGGGFGRLYQANMNRECNTKIKRVLTVSFVLALCLAVGIPVSLAFQRARYSSPLTAMTFTVVNTNDSGAGSLRQAILDANANPGTNLITFSIGP